MQKFSEMAAALAHEIKNPVAVALAHVNLLRLDSTEDLAFHLDHIENALTDVCNLVKEMLSAAQDATAYEVDLHRILTEILETYRAAWPDIVFSLKIPDESAALPCFGHETSLRMIFSNLIKNAVEATETSNAAGEIQITARYSDEFLCVTITDNAEFLPAPKPDGNGLGLAICRNLANGIGAHLSSKTTKTGGLAVTVKLRTLCPSFA